VTRPVSDVPCTSVCLGLSSDPLVLVAQILLLAGLLLAVTDLLKVWPQ
jgi:hypothetical protein